MKIRIIGCSGSGMTYLAQALSEKYSIPHFDLDDIQWDNAAQAYGVKMPREKRAAMLREILDHRDWIIEGVYYKWGQQSFEDADVIYVLNMPGHVYASRIVMRAIRRKLGVEKGKKETLKSVWNLLKWTETYQHRDMEEIRRILAPYGEKVVWLSGKRDVKNIISQSSNAERLTIAQRQKK